METKRHVQRVRDQILEQVFGTSAPRTCPQDEFEAGQSRLLAAFHAQTNPDLRILYWFAAYHVECAPPPSQAGLTRHWEAIARTAVQVGKASAQLRNGGGR